METAVRPPRAKGQQKVPQSTSFLQEPLDWTQHLIGLYDARRRILAPPLPVRWPSAEWQKEF